MLRRKITVAAVASVALLLGGSGLAAADGGSPTSSPSAGPTGDGSKALCKRAVRIDKRIDKALTRLNGPASVRGSIARLQQRVAEEIGAPVGRLVLHAKSAHIYEPDWELMRGVGAVGLTSRPAT